ncbi:MAG: CobW family GTP-binding protein [Terrimicrobiaceae bacterium]
MTPLVLVVGFLGAGKTTFLKSLMPELAGIGIRPGLLINDYQNARVDAEQFRDLVEEVKALSGDCVCCGSRDQLLAELQAFDHAKNRVMLVETNGTTDSEQLLEVLSLDPDLKRFTLPIQLSLIDAQRWQKRFWHNALERQQARTASHISLSRTDTVGAARMEEVHVSLERIGVRGTPTTPQEFASELAGLCREPSSDREVEHMCGGGCGHHDHAGAHSHTDHETHHFASCEFLLPDRVCQKSFREMLRELPREVIRAKGLVRFQETSDEFYVFQKLDDDVQFFPVGPAPRVSTPLALFIGPNLPEQELREKIASL